MADPIPATLPSPAAAKPWYASKFTWLTLFLALCLGVTGGVDYVASTGTVGIPAWVHYAYGIIVAILIPAFRGASTGAVDSWWKPLVTAIVTAIVAFALVFAIGRMPAKAVVAPVTSDVPTVILDVPVVADPLDVVPVSPEVVAPATPEEVVAPAAAEGAVPVQEEVVAPENKPVSIGVTFRPMALIFEVSPAS